MAAQLRQRKLTGAVLCGGASSRMGRAKHRIVLDGRPMIDYVINALAPLCHRIVILGGAAPDPLSQDGVHMHIKDLRPGLGPLGGIEALLASGIDEEYLVCPCDVPRITPEVLEALLVGRNRHATVLRLAGRETIQPLPTRLSSCALPAVRRMLDEETLAVSELHARLESHVADIPLQWQPLLANINSPSDLDALNKR